MYNMSFFVSKGLLCLMIQIKKMDQTFGLLFQYQVWVDSSWYDYIPIHIESLLCSQFSSGFFFPSTSRNQFQR